MEFNKKGSVQQVFVYAVSTIIVVFVGFLALNFLGVLGSDVENRSIQDFQSNIELELTQIRGDFNSENIKTFRIPGIISKITFITPSCAQSYADDFDGHYIVLYDSQDQVLDFRELEGFRVQGGCFEVEGVEFMDLAFKNERNEVIIEDLTS